MTPLIFGFVLGVSMSFPSKQPPAKPDPPNEPEETDPYIVQRYQELLALGVGVRDAETFAGDLHYVDVVHEVKRLLEKGATVPQAVEIIR